MSCDPVARLLAVADEHGQVMDRDLARAWHETYGYDGACELIAMATRLVGVAALDMHERLSFARACQLMVGARRDFGAARRRLGMEVLRSRRGDECGSPRADAIEEAAAEAGLRVDRRTARRWADDPARDPLARMRAIGRIRDAGSRHGVHVDLAGASARMGGDGDDPGPAISRIERRARNRRLLQSHLCRLHRRPAELAARIDAAAWCRCRGCFPRLLEDLAPYADAILHRHSGRLYPDQDWRDTQELLRQDAAIVLFDALLDWPDGPGFKPYFGGALANHLSGERRRMKTEKRDAGRPLLALDEPYVTTYGRVVSWEERLDGYSINPLTLLLIKEELAKRMHRRRKDAAWLAFVYDELNRQS